MNEFDNENRTNGENAPQGIGATENSAASPLGADAPQYSNAGQNATAGYGQQDTGDSPVQASQPAQPSQSFQSVHSSYEGTITSPNPPVGQPVSTSLLASQTSSHPGGGSQFKAAPTAAQMPHAAASTTGSGNAVIYGPPKKSSKAGKTFLIAFAGALVACLLAFGAMFAFGAFNGGNSVTLGSNTAAQIDAAAEDATLAEQVASRCLPSVVSITVMGNQTGSSGSSIYDYLYGFGQQDEGSNELSQIGLGSGVIISEDGYVLTNYHVVEDGKQYQLTVGSETKEAELVGSDPSSDVAVLKIKDGGNYTAIQLGNSDNIKIGEWVMSIGSPFGLEQSVATGIISATSRSQIMDSDTNELGQSSGEVTIYPNMIQTDAAINPGNSGGALVNSQGELIGINTLITSYSGNYSGVGFAIPSNYATSIAQSIISGKTPTHAFLGITMTTINDNNARMYGFSVDSGAYVSSVVAGSAADKGGLKVGDIIVGFDGQTVSSSSDVTLDVRSKDPGDKVEITVVRDGNEQKLEVTLGESDQSSSSSKDSSSNKDDSGNGYGGSGNGRGFSFGF